LLLRKLTLTLIPLLAFPWCNRPKLAQFGRTNETTRFHYRNCISDVVAARGSRAAVGNAGYKISANRLTLTRTVCAHFTVA
jgi:hypothetical protein